MIGFPQEGLRPDLGHSEKASKGWELVWGGAGGEEGDQRSRGARGLEEATHPTPPGFGPHGPLLGVVPGPSSRAPAGVAMGWEQMRRGAAALQSQPVLRLLPQEQWLPGTSAVAMATTEVLTG